MLAEEVAIMADHKSYHDYAKLFAWTGLTTVSIAMEEFELDKSL